MPFPMAEDGLFEDGRKASSGRYVSCYHCIHCPISSSDDIVADGWWKCTYLRRWFRGTDVYEYSTCRGYRRKRCGLCVFEKRCQAEWRLDHGTIDRSNNMPKWTWCHGFRMKGAPDTAPLFYGRRSAYSGSNDMVRRNEERFWKRISDDMDEIRMIAKEVERKA